VRRNDVSREPATQTIARTDMARPASTGILREFQPQAPVCIRQGDTMGPGAHNNAEQLRISFKPIAV
jgi:hypothetical protein